MSKRHLYTSLVLVLIVSVSVFAQPGGGGPGGGGDPDVPITGLEVLLAAGGILGIRKYLKSSRK